MKNLFLIHGYIEYNWKDCDNYLGNVIITMYIEDNLEKMKEEFKKVLNHGRTISDACIDKITRLNFKNMKEVHGINRNEIHALEQGLSNFVYYNEINKEYVFEKYDFSEGKNVYNILRYSFNTKMKAIVIGTYPVDSIDIIRKLLGYKYYVREENITLFPFNEKIDDKYDLDFLYNDNDDNIITTILFSNDSVINDVIDVISSIPEHKKIDVLIIKDNKLYNIIDNIIEIG